MSGGNPNHDEKGRFTDGPSSSSGGATAAPATFKSKEFKTKEDAWRALEKLGSNWKERANYRIKKHGPGKFTVTKVGEADAVTGKVAKAMKP